MSERFSNLWLFARCLLRLMVHGRACAVSDNPDSVVVVQQGKLGDMVCTTPMFRALKERLPQAKVYVIGDSVNGQVLAGNRDIDEYLAVGTDPAEALAALRRLHPRVGIITTPSLRALAILYLAGTPTIIAPRVVGGHSAESRLYTALRPIAHLVEHRMGQYAAGEYLRMLRPLGIDSSDTRKHIAVSDSAKKAIDKRLAGIEGPLVGISPSAGNRIKQWPPERFAQVAEHLFARYGATIVILGGPKDTAEITGMARAISPQTRVLNLGSKLTIEELKALIARLSLFVSVDTGPIYLAEALNIPTVDIVGPVDEREQPPQGPRHLLVIPARTKPELHVMNPSGYNFAEARRQTESITAEQVIRAVDELMRQTL